MDMEHERRLTEVEQRSKSNMKRINDMEARQENLDKLVNTVGILADREARVEDDVKEIKIDVKSLTEKPGKRFDNLIDKILLTVAAALVGFILAQIGL